VSYELPPLYRDISEACGLVETNKLLDIRPVRSVKNNERNKPPTILATDTNRSVPYNPNWIGLIGMTYSDLTFPQFHCSNP
jgi:hypothetical protein